MLVGFKLSVGNDLYMRILLDRFRESGVNVDACGDINYTGDRNLFYCIGKGGDGKSMFFDTLNPLNWYRFYNVLRKKKYSVVFFLASHPLNLVAILISRYLFGVRAVSHIHDPYAHGGAKYSNIINVTHKLQAFLSDRLVVYGETVKKMIVDGYGIKDSKISVIVHGVYRKDKLIYSVPERRFISLLGRIEWYKGIDVFIKAAKIVLSDSSYREKVVFVIGGEGDMRAYQELLTEFRYPDNIRIINKRLSDDEFDDILSCSYISVLPYYDATQTGNIQVAYYNACPVLVTEVGGLPEMVENGKTGMVVPPGNEKALAEAMIAMLSDPNIEKYFRNAFAFYRGKLRWEDIAGLLLNELMKS